VVPVGVADQELAQRHPRTGPARPAGRPRAPHCHRRRAVAGRARRRLKCSRKSGLLHVEQQFECARSRRKRASCDRTRSVQASTVASSCVQQQQSVYRNVGFYVVRARDRCHLDASDSPTSVGAGWRSRPGRHPRPCSATGHCACRPAVAAYPLKHPFPKRAREGCRTAWRAQASQPVFTGRWKPRRRTACCQAAHRALEPRAEQPRLPQPLARPGEFQKQRAAGRQRAEACHHEALRLRGDRLSQSPARRGRRRR
jgi:hypothetical protein